MTQYVYFFGGGKADGHKDMKDTLGGKGSGLAEMTNAGVPVPPGFTITTQACNAFYGKGGLPKAVVSVLASCRTAENNSRVYPFRMRIIGVGKSVAFFWG